MILAFWSAPLTQHLKPAAVVKLGHLACVGWAMVGWVLLCVSAVITHHPKVSPYVIASYLGGMVAVFAAFVACAWAVRRLTLYLAVPRIQDKYIAWLDRRDVNKARPASPADLSDLFALHRHVRLTKRKGRRFGACRHGLDKFADEYFPHRRSVTLGELQPFLATGRCSVSERAYVLSVGLELLKKRGIVARTATISLRP